MNLPQSKTKNIVVLNLENEMLVYDLEINKAFCLNETSSIVYQNCDGKTSFAELRKRYKFTDDLIFFTLDELKKERLIETNYASPFEKMSRREIVKEIGLSTIIALPIISSVIAPSSINAASGACVTTGCTADNYTQANCCGSTNRCFGNNLGPGFGNCGSCYPPGDFSAIFNVSGRCADPAYTFNSQNACCSGAHVEVFVGGLYECQCT
ncbi:MAG: hypothetical protein K1X72_27885 [Pyrinomonadaceae bacterium]|nr:hypothetical protein [Pyrinomonadaceae bacterium]